jgi:hypothetical protein
MLRQRTTLLVAPAIAALLGAGAMAHAMAQTIVTAPVQTTIVPLQTAPATTVVVAPMAPPAPLSETVPVAPATATVTTYWQPGHWNWNDGAWTWVNGAYLQRVQQPTVAAVWVPGQWVMQTDGSYAWMTGHWQG